MFNLVCVFSVHSVSPPDCGASEAWKRNIQEFHKLQHHAPESKTFQSEGSAHFSPHPGGLVIPLRQSTLAFDFKVLQGRIMLLRGYESSTLAHLIGALGWQTQDSTAEKQIGPEEKMSSSSELSAFSLLAGYHLPLAHQRETSSGREPLSLTLNLPKVGLSND